MSRRTLGSTLTFLPVLLLAAACSGADGAAIGGDDDGGDGATVGPGTPGTPGSDARAPDGSVDPNDATLPDASPPFDAGHDATSNDAGVDSSPSDAQTDAPADTGADAPPDAGPPPTCTVTVAPATGTTSDTFTGSLVSANATTCSAVVDGNSPTTIPCNGSVGWPGTSFGGAGVHSVIVSVAGPGGASQCATSWTVTTPGVATCTVSVTPSRGKVSDTYTGQLTSSGASSCAYRVDNGAPTSVPCSGSIPFQGSLYGPGTHVVVVTASGDGASTCSATWLETP